MSATHIVELLLTAPAAGEPMQAHTAVELVAGVGIAGDRYATGRGHWSDPRWPDQEITLIAAESLELLGLRPEQLRRNVVTRGTDLATLLGVEFTIGETRLAGVRPCDPCRYIERFTRSGAFEELDGHAGIRARILRGGPIAVGDLIVRCSSAGPAADPKTGAA